MWVLALASGVVAIIVGFWASNKAVHAVCIYKLVGPYVQVGHFAHVTHNGKNAGNVC